MDWNLDGSRGASVASKDKIINREKLGFSIPRESS